MISLRLYDAGTKAVVVPEPPVPGCTEMYWRQLHFDEMTGERMQVQTALQTELLSGETQDVSIEPWPARMPGRMWVDVCEEYEWDGLDGARIECYALGTDVVDPGAPERDGSEVACGPALVDLAPEPVADLKQGNLLHGFNWEEIRDRYLLAGDRRWTRLPTRNESGGTTRLGRPAVVGWDGLDGFDYRLMVPDQRLFAPFDLRQPERYRVNRETTMAAVEDGRWYRFTQDGSFALYMMPRRWRWTVFVMAHYLWISWFEMVPFDLIFVQGFWDRPPVYPVRHDVLHTSQVTDTEGVFGNWISYDAGIDRQYDASRMAGILRHEIVMAQWADLCQTTLLMGVEPAEITIQTWEPQAGDYVAGIGWRDEWTDREQRVWLAQLANASVTDYPRTTLGTFQSNFFNVYRDL